VARWRGVVYTESRWAWRGRRMRVLLSRVSSKSYSQLDHISAGVNPISADVVQLGIALRPSI